VPVGGFVGVRQEGVKYGAILLDALRLAWVASRGNTC
jgi:hypothetical protein